MAPQGWIFEQCQTVTSVEKAAFSWSPEHSRELTLPPDKSWTHPTCWDPVSKKSQDLIQCHKKYLKQTKRYIFESITTPVLISVKHDFGKVPRTNNFDLLEM